MNEEELKKQQEELDRQMELMVSLNENRFGYTSPDQVQLLSDDGRVLSSDEALAYAEEQKQKNTSVHDVLSIGDVVKVKDIDVPLTVVATKEETTYNLSGFDYGGESEVDNSQVLLFDQDEIEQIIFKAGKTK